MNLSEAKNVIQEYLDSRRTSPIIVDVQTKQDRLDLANAFRNGENKFVNEKKLVEDDGNLKFEDIYDAIRNNEGNKFYTNLSGFMMLQGEGRAKRLIRNIMELKTHGHVVIITYQCSKFFETLTQRMLASGRVIVVDGEPDKISDICFVDPDYTYAFSTHYNGLTDIGYAVENCRHDVAYLIAKVKINTYGLSLLNLSKLDSPYDILKMKDPMTEQIPQDYAKWRFWEYALKKMGDGNWKSLVEDELGEAKDLYDILSAYPTLNEHRKWLYFIALKLFGTKENEYLQMVADNTTDYNFFAENAINVISSVDKSDSKYEKIASERQEVLDKLKEGVEDLNRGLKTQQWDKFMK